MCVFLCVCVCVRMCFFFGGGGGGQHGPLMCLMNQMYQLNMIIITRTTWLSFPLSYVWEYQFVVIPATSIVGVIMVFVKIVHLQRPNICYTDQQVEQLLSKIDQSLGCLAGKVMVGSLNSDAVNQVLGFISRLAISILFQPLRY